MEMVGQQDTYGESGKPEELKKKYKMTAEDIVKAVQKSNGLRENEDYYYEEKKFKSRCALFIGFYHVFWPGFMRRRAD